MYKNIFPNLKLFFVIYTVDLPACSFVNAIWFTINIVSKSVLPTLPFLGVSVGGGAGAGDKRLCLFCILFFSKNSLRIK